MAKLVQSIGIAQNPIPLENIGTDTYGRLVKHAFSVPNPAGSGNPVTLEVTKPITFRESSETTRKGVVRIMRRVEIPYTALYPSDTVTGDSNLKVSPTRSRGALSVHIVLTLPKECVDDIKAQVAGQSGLHLAEMQVAQIIGLGEGMGALTPPTLGAMGSSEQDARASFGEFQGEGDTVIINPPDGGAGGTALRAALTRYLNGYSTAADTEMVKVGVIDV